MSNDKLAEALREPAEKFAQAMEKDADRIGGEWKTVLTTAAQCIRALLQAHAAEAAQAQARVPGAKYPDDGCGDEDSYNAGWNACRDAMLASATQQAAEPAAWPFVESPGEIADRLKDALENGCPLLGAVRQVFIENPPLYTHPQPAQDAKLPSDEDFRLHLGELTPAELRVAQAAARYVLAGTAQDAKDAARFRWLRDSADSYTWDYLGGIGADRVDAAVDAAMAKESGR